MPRIRGTRPLACDAWSMYFLFQIYPLLHVEQRPHVTTNTSEVALRNQENLLVVVEIRTGYHKRIWRLGTGAFLLLVLGGLCVPRRLPRPDVTIPSSHAAIPYKVLHRSTLCWMT